MPSQLTTQTEKFNVKMRKAAGKQAEAKLLEEKGQKAAFDAVSQYGMTGTQRLFEQGVLEEQAAMVLSHTGVTTFFQTLESFGARLVEQATAPLKAEIGELKALLIEQQKQERITQMLVEQLLCEKEFPASRQDKMKVFMDDYRDAPQDELVDLNPQPRNKNKNIDLPKLVEIEVTKDVGVAVTMHGWEVKWKRGKKPQRIVDALHTINQHVKFSKIDWPKDEASLRALIKEFLIVAQYEGLDIYNTTVMQPSRYKRVTIKISNSFGSYKNFVKEMF